MVSFCFKLDKPAQETQKRQHATVFHSFSSVPNASLTVLFTSSNVPPREEPVSSCAVATRRDSDAHTAGQHITSQSQVRD